MVLWPFFSCGFFIKYIHSFIHSETHTKENWFLSASRFILLIILIFFTDIGWLSCTCGELETPRVGTWVILSQSNQTLSGPCIYMYVYIGAFRIICHFAYADIWGNYSKTDEILPPCISGCIGWSFPVGPQLMRWRIRLVILATARNVPTCECHISSHLYAHDTDTHAPTDRETDAHAATCIRHINLPRHWRQMHINPYCCMLNIFLYFTMSFTLILWWLYRLTNAICDYDFRTLP